MYGVNRQIRQTERERLGGKNISSTNISCGKQAAVTLLPSELQISTNTSEHPGALGVGRERGPNRLPVLRMSIRRTHTHSQPCTCTGKGQVPLLPLSGHGVMMKEVFTLVFLTVMQ